MSNPFSPNPTRQVFSDDDNYIDDVTDADLYRCVELNCELPGASQLQVRVRTTTKKNDPYVCFVRLRDCVVASVSCAL